MRALANFRTGFPHQLGHISNHAATVAEVLRAEGYATFCAGKWHLAPTRDISAAGPFDQWPLGRGFDRFYGFLGERPTSSTPSWWRTTTTSNPRPSPKTAITSAKTWWTSCSS